MLKRVLLWLSPVVLIAAILSCADSPVEPGPDDGSGSGTGTDTTSTTPPPKSAIVAITTRFMNIGQPVAQPAAGDYTIAVVEDAGGDTAVKATGKISATSTLSLRLTAKTRTKPVSLRGYIRTDKGVVWTGRSTPFAISEEATIPATIEFYQGGADNLDVTAVQIDKPDPASRVLIAGDTLRLTARAMGGDEIYKIRWMSSDTALLTVDSAGKVKAKNAGQAVAYAAAGAAWDSVRFQVNVAPVSIRLTPATDTIRSVGSTTKLQAEFLDANKAPIAGANMNIFWTSSDTTAVKSAGDGTFIAQKVGRSTITAVMDGRPTVKGTAIIQVVQRPASITLSPKEFTLNAVGSKQKIDATVYDANLYAISGIVPKWTSQDSSVAKVDATGTVTAIKNGTARITATAGGTSSTATVTVTQGAYSISLSARTSRLLAGDTVRILATVLDSLKVPVAGAKITWGTDNAEVANVDSTGLVTGRKVGIAQIRASSNGAVATLAVSTSVGKLAKLRLLRDTATFIAIGDTAKFPVSAADAFDNPITAYSVSWATGDPKIVTVSTGIGRSVANGQTIITASSNYVSDTAYVTVSQVAAKVTVAQAALTLNAIGSTAAVGATTRDRNGYAAADAGRVRWYGGTLSDRIVTVADTGSVTAVGTGGPYWIYATVGTSKDSMKVTVQQVPAAVSFTYAPVAIDLADTVRARAAVADSNGYPMGNATILWATSNAALATVTSSGLIRGIGAGGVRITARSGTASAGFDLAIRQLIPANLVSTTNTALSGKAGSVLSDTISVRVTDAQGKQVAGAIVYWTPTSDGVVSPASSITGADGRASTRWALRRTVGSDTLFATVENVTPVTFTAAVTPGAVASVVASREAVIFRSLGDTLRLSAYARDAYNNNVTSVIGWAVTDTARLSVTAEGLVTARRNGESMVIASQGGAADTVLVTVSQVPAAIQTTVVRDTLAFAGDSLQVDVVVMDAGGSVITTPLVTFTSLDPAYGSVSANGMVHALLSGLLRILVQAGDVTKTVTFTIL